jgi:uncharacterized membrane protein
MKKVVWTILSLVVVAALVIGGLREFHSFMYNHERGAFAQYSQHFQGQDRGFYQGQEQFGFAERNSQPFAFAVRGDNRGGHYGVHRHEWFGGTIFGVIGHVLMIAAGWALWKRGGRRSRWIGGVLIALGVVPLLVMAAAIAIPVGLVYWIWRAIRKKQQSDEDFEIAMPVEKPFTASKNDLLDEWEAKTRRQLNDKKEEE